MMSPMGLGAVALLVIAMTHLIYRWRNPKCPAGGVLPPGSMGLPLIGETIQLIIPSYSLDVSPFIKKRLTKYGAVFKTSMAGRPMVISADAEVNHFILQQEGKSVESWYLDLFAKLFKQGDARPDAAYVHKYVRHLALGHFGMESLKGKLLVQMEQMVNRTLTNWASQGSVEMKHASAAMALEFGARLLFSFDPEKSDLNLTDNFMNFSKGLMTFPINIPGTAYHKCLQDYEKAKDMMLGVVKERQASGETKGDVLDHALADMKVEKFLTEDFLAQMMFGLLFVTFDSVSSTMIMAFKLLSENPSVLHDLTKEHEALLKRRKDPNSPLTWEEYKSMTFTLYVINETLRLASASPGLMRRAKKDIQVKGGYTIPAGWGIMVLSSALHLNPNTFEDPLAFNPWRWKGMSTSVVSKNFMPFGSGMKQCAGAEYSRVLLSTFLHVLVTKFKWNKIEGGDIVRTPILRFTNGLRINVSKITDSESEVAAA